MEIDNKTMTNNTMLINKMLNNNIDANDNHDCLNMTATLEALLFAYGDPIPTGTILEVLQCSDNDLALLIESLEKKYMLSNSGIMLKRVGEKLTLATKPCYNDPIRFLMEPTVKQGLTHAAYESLSVVAYHQPVTKARIEKIRGVNSDSPLHTLLEKGLIERAGKLDVPGHPTLFRTTDLFLKDFNFDSLDDLPEIITEEDGEIFDEEMVSEINIEKTDLVNEVSEIDSDSEDISDIIKEFDDIQH